MIGIKERLTSIRKKIEERMVEEAAQAEESAREATKQHATKLIEAAISKVGDAVRKRYDNVIVAGYSSGECPELAAELVRQLDGCDYRRVANGDYIRCELHF